MHGLIMVRANEAVQGPAHACRAARRRARAIMGRRMVKVRVGFLALQEPHLSPGQRYRLEAFLPSLDQRAITVRYDWLLDRHDLRVFYGHGAVAGKALVAGRKPRQPVCAAWPARATWTSGSCSGRRSSSAARGANGSPASARRSSTTSTTPSGFAPRRPPTRASPGSRTWRRFRASSAWRTPSWPATTIWPRGPAPTPARCVVVPTCVDTDVFAPLAARAAGSPVTIGWSGSASTIAHLVPLLPVLERVQARYGDAVRLRVMGDATFTHAPLGLRGEAWSPERELALLREMDIGLMPLPDDEWTRGKCGLKGLVSMAMGAASVMSPVGVNTTIVRDGVNGFLPASDEAWFEVLCRLVEDRRPARAHRGGRPPDRGGRLLRDAVGAGARRRVRGARRSARLELRANRPQVGKRRLQQRRAQIGGARRSAGARLHANRALHHLHVPVAPLLHAFVEVHEALAHLGVLRVGLVDAHEHVLQRGRRLDRRGRVDGQHLLGHRIAFALEIRQEAVPERRLGETRGQGGAGARAFAEALEGRDVPAAEHELELAELVGLEAARLLEARAERLELERRHGLEDVELRHQHLQDGEDALERVLGAVGLVGVEQAPHVVELVQDLLEPQLVDLVDHDEEHLVVLGAVRERPLQREQLVDAQVRVVGDGAIAVHRSQPTSKTASREDCASASQESARSRRRSTAAPPDTRWPGLPDGRPWSSWQRRRRARSARRGVRRGAHQDGGRRRCGGRARLGLRRTPRRLERRGAQSAHWS